MTRARPMSWAMVRDRPTRYRQAPLPSILRVAELCETRSLPLQYLPPLKPFELLFRASGSVVVFKPLECFDFICSGFCVLCNTLLADTLCTNCRTFVLRRFALTCDMP